MTKFKSNILTKLKPEIVTNQMMTKLKNLNFDKTQKLKLWHLWQFKLWQILKDFFDKDNLTPHPLTRCTLGSVLRSRVVFDWNIDLSFSHIFPKSYIFVKVKLLTSLSSLYLLSWKQWTNINWMFVTKKFF